MKSDSFRQIKKKKEKVEKLNESESRRDGVHCSYAPGPYGKGYAPAPYGKGGSPKLEYH